MFVKAIYCCGSHEQQRKLPGLCPEPNDEPKSTPSTFMREVSLKT